MLLIIIMIIITMTILQIIKLRHIEVKYFAQGHT